MSETNKTTPSLVMAIVFMIAAVLFILAAVIVFEYGSVTTADGDTITPWYFWLLLAFSFLCFFIIIVIYIFMPYHKSQHLEKKPNETVEENLKEQQLPIYTFDTSKVSDMASQIYTSVSKKLFEPEMGSISSLARNS